MLLVALATLAALAPCGASPLNVLFVSTVSSPSHYIWVSSLAGELLRRGHHVTELVIKPPATPHPNRTSFVIDGKIYAETTPVDLETIYDHSLFEEIHFLYDFCRDSANIVFESKAFADLLKLLKQKKPDFDVFVLDFPLQEPFIGLNYIIGRKPMVAMTAFNLPVDVLTLMGSPYFPSLLPYSGVGAHGGDPLTFSERLHSVYRWIGYTTYINWVYRPDVDKMIAEVFPGAPPLAELEKDVAISLVNTNPALHGAMPLVPSIVEVGGMQARPPKPLPADILEWINEKAAPHGFVFMSFGTNVRAASLSKGSRDAILRAFARIKQRVLWKYEDDDILDKLPPNVRVAKWLPQNDILAHPNIRCFVSHNGGLSTQEASYHGVPILGMPFFSDQLGYAKKGERIGISRTVIYRTATEEAFYEALTDVINNPKYRANMKVVQNAVRDQKETPVERAAWYVEMVARTGGAPHLRSPALRLRWYEVWMLDILAAAALAVGLALWLVRRLLGALCSSGGARRRTKAKAH
ncbi:UDP-glycosyltransferase-06 [Frankliniella occidentalis]|uniref:UDP-glycosyltransferase UGT5-like isoform X4 n=1 Tax=Frankliniella occidentalis TaxID=133901 RepID=A0A6J1S5B5_FRAOC|nr:UDP-glycosyltransferase UGT5-like isoform X4 [Frankliniella occidentalis]KAE8749662.1 UDP-glycosyltransferase-06 [Frankliniella occidentalis]